MTEISASLVRDLREKTGAGMMDCKKALVECSGNFNEAIDWLRKKGHAAASKKSGRSTSEGAIAVMVNGSSGIMLEVNSETDFVARNDKFQALVTNLGKIALEANSLADLESKTYQGKGTVKDAVVETVSVVGENINLNRFVKLNVSNGAVASYIHNSLMPNAGKIGVLVALEVTKGTIANADLVDFGRKIAMHIAAAKPEALSNEDVDSAKLEKEREIFSEQARTSGKPENIIEKMVEGRIRKYYEEVVLLSQIFVMDNKSKISEVVEEFAKKHGLTLAITSFARYELGEATTSGE